MLTLKRQFLVIAIIFLLFPLASLFARDNIVDWYIKDFQSEMVVNKDSSLLITEKITADCDSLPNKHGIFRILPIKMNINGTLVNTPIKLISISDFNNKSIKFDTKIDSQNNTVSWRIGDPNKTVTGVNYYKIVYSVKNAVRFELKNFDELYWNLNGHFFIIDTDNFTGKIIFPQEINKDNTKVWLYTGLLGNRSDYLANYQWLDNNTLQVISKRVLHSGEGITISANFPKNILVPPVPTFFEKYGAQLQYLWFLLPIIAFIVCFRLWWKYGKDPRVNRSIAPEFGPPDNLAPMEAGALLNYGNVANSFISATIIDLAARGVITIKEIDKKWYEGSKDFKLTLNAQTPQRLKKFEEGLIDKMFVGEQTILISSLKNRFYKQLPIIEREIRDSFYAKNLLVKNSGIVMAMFIAAFIFFGFMIIIGARFFHSLTAMISAFVAIFIVVIFGLMMPKRTPKGADLMWRIKGFKLYMETAEKYRQQFFEKENTFEKLLPYAMVFGITHLWIKKMEQLYAQENKAFVYAPAWYIGLNAASFNVDSFTQNLNSISSHISSSMSAPGSGGSGFGGGGFSGGGGGGGGGGGW